MGMNPKENEGLGRKSNGRLGFLLSQIGAHASVNFAERIKPLGISPAHAGIIRILARSAGLSQKELSNRLSILPSRLVVLVDELERMDVVERRDDPDDRRSYALHLKSKGQQLMAQLGELASAHSAALAEGLSSAERSTLIELLSKIAETQGLRAGVHPGYK